MENQVIRFEEVLQPSVLMVDGTKQDVFAARDLYILLKNLGPDNNFTHWAERRIEKYGFIDGEDFVFCLSLKDEQKGSGGHNKKEYYLTTDTAMEFAMLEENEIGRKVRKHFIACRKELAKYKSPEASIANLQKEFKKTIATFQFAGLSKTDSIIKARDFLLDQTNIDCFVLFPGVKAQIEYKQNTFTISQLARALDISKERVKILINHMNIYYKESNVWKTGRFSGPYIAEFNQYTGRVLFTKLCLDMLRFCIEHSPDAWDKHAHKPLAA